MHLPAQVARLCAGTALCVGLGLPARAEMVPSVNMIGDTGLIDMPSAEMQPDGFLTLDSAHMGPIFRESVSFQFLPRLSGTFRYIGIKKWNDAFCPPECLGVNKYETYYDRNFDVSYQILTEGKWRPALSIGLQDFAGTGINSAEYVAMTKTFGGRLKLTGGLGFGRLGSYDPVFSLGTRPSTDVGKGGKPNYAQWFHGDAAPFAGLEYAIDDRWSVKAEYSSDAYRDEAGIRQTFERASPFNFGIEYHPNRTFGLGAYYMYGSTLAFNLSVSLNPAQRPGGNLRGPAPYPVLVRPSPAADPAAWVTGWTENEGVNATFMAALNNYLDRDIGLQVEGVEITGDRVQVRYRSSVYDAPSQAAGRVARALTYVMPASIEVFDLVPMERGLPATKITIYRSNLEKFEGELGAGDALLVRSRFGIPGPLPSGYTPNPELYPHFTWAILPYAESRTFDPADPFQINAGLQLSFSAEPAPGVIFSGAATQMILRGITNPVNLEPSVLPHVRSESSAYQVIDGPSIDRLTMAIYRQLAPELYGRVTVGYLERMFGGISTEMLWRPEGRMWALGVEANYVAQRDVGDLGFDQWDYQVATGHVSGYFDLGRGYTAQLDVGRYLAGDVGATVTLSREFSNGWRIGGFATLTNVSAERFGEGSFDKGVYFRVPMNWFIGRPTKAMRAINLRPIQRDGGARLVVSGRLNDVLRDYDTQRLTVDWGRFWK